MIHKRSTALEWSANPFHGANLTLSSDVDQDTLMFKGPNISLHHLLEHINQDIKGIEQR